MEQQDRPGWNPPSGDATPPTFPSASPGTDVPLSASTHLTSTARRSRIGTGIAVAAVGIGALGLAGTAYASSTSPTPTPEASGNTAPRLADPGEGTTPEGMPGDRGGRHGGPGGPGMGGGHGMRGLGMGMGIHGIVVVPKQDGGFQTVHSQRGVVTGVSTTSITVKSEDGYTKTYVVGADTVVNAQRDGIASIKVDDEVTVVGIESGSDVDAVRIMDRTSVEAGMKKLAPPQPAASPSASGSTA